MRARWFAHVDMDAFYASVEVLDRPELEGLPVVVGGPAEHRGVIAAASYAARTFGVRSAMPTAQAFQLCPDLVLLPGRMERYKEKSSQVMEILREVAPKIEPLSLDEAALDLTGCARVHGINYEEGERAGWERFATELRGRILECTGLWCSIGFGETRRIAKIASDLNKPRGLVVVPRGEGVSFLATLPIEKIGGVGVKTASRLHVAGLHTAGDVADCTRAHMRAVLGSFGEHLHDIVHARESSHVDPARAHRSISHECTFSVDRVGLDALEGTLLTHCERVGTRLRRSEMQGRIVQLKIRDAGFHTFTRRLTLPRPTNSDAALHAAALRLLRGLGWEQVPVRLLGVGMSDLTSISAWQGDLFSEGQDRRDRSLDRVLDKVYDRFGDRAIGHGRSLLDPHRSAAGGSWPLSTSRSPLSNSVSDSVSISSRRPS